MWYEHHDSIRHKFSCCFFFTFLVVSYIKIFECMHFRSKVFIIPKCCWDNWKKTTNYKLASPKCTLFIHRHWWEFNSRLHQSVQQQQQSFAINKLSKWSICSGWKRNKNSNDDDERCGWKIHESMNQPSLFGLSSIYISYSVSVHFNFN